MSNVYSFDSGKEQINIGEFLDLAKGNFESCMLVGWDNDGDPSFGVYNMKATDIFLLTAIVKRQMLDRMEDTDG